MSERSGGNEQEHGQTAGGRSGQQDGQPVQREIGGGIAVQEKERGHKRASAREEASVEDALSQLHADAERGLSSDEAEKRLEKYGPNTIEESKKNPLLKLLSYFWGPIPWMLEAACALSAVGGRWEEFFVILTMLLINGGVGWWHESRAEQAIEALKETLSPKARVLRDGERRVIDATQIVPGDVIILRRGDVTPADAKLLEGGL